MEGRNRYDTYPPSLLPDSPLFLPITPMQHFDRQIRKMAEAVGLSVVNLHRTSFGGISLKGVSEGNWCELSEKEMETVQQALEAAVVTTTGSGSIDYEDDVEE